MTITLAENCEWQIYQKILVPYTPPHFNIELTEDEAQKLLNTYTNALLVRFTSEFDANREYPFWYIIKDEFEGMDNLSSNTRSKIRRGFKRCDVKKVSKNVIRESGFQVFASAHQRYNISVSVSKKEFQKNIDLLSEKDYEFWAVSHKKTSKLIAYSQNRIQDGCASYITIKFDPKHLRDYSSYCLIHAMNEHYLSNRSDIMYVNDGLRSVYHETRFQDFLVQKFLFRKARCKLHVFFKKPYGIILKMVYPFRRLLTWLPGQNAKKLSALFYQQKKINEQNAVE